MDPSILDAFYMERALQLGAQGLGRASPNPIVGAIVVSDDRIVGEGFHLKPGNPHAEVLALEQAGEKAQGAALYVSLEPCCHHGRNPPCVERVCSSGVARVVVGMLDPDPRMNGKSLEIMKEAGLEVEMSDSFAVRRCIEMNRFYLRRLRSGIPFVTLKYASSLDGKIATRTGDSQWISGLQARRWVHRERNVHDAAMVGIGTVLADDPQLTARDPKGRTPGKIIVDSQGRLPRNARLLDDRSHGVYVITSEEGAQKLAGRPELNLIVGDLHSSLRELAKAGINSILLEGGGNLNAGMVEAGLVDQVAAFICPRFIGGSEAISALEGLGAARVADGWHLREVTWRNMGEDLRVEGYLKVPWELG